MKKAIAALALGLLVAAPAAWAGISLVNPGLYTDIGYPIEARIRLDHGASQSHKLAFFFDGAMVASGANQLDLFADGTVYPFSLAYDVNSGELTLEVAGESLTDVLPLHDGMELAAIRVLTRSTVDGGSTHVSELQISDNGDPATAVADVLSDVSDGLVYGPFVWFDRVVDQVSLTGAVTFDWLDGADVAGDRFKFAVILVEGDPASVASETTTWGSVKVLFE